MLEDNDIVENILRYLNNIKSNLLHYYQLLSRYKNFRSCIEARIISTYVYSYRKRTSCFLTEIVLLQMLTVDPSPILTLQFRWYSQMDMRNDFSDLKNLGNYIYILHFLIFSNFGSSPCPCIPQCWRYSQISEKWFQQLWNLPYVIPVLRFMTFRALIPTPAAHSFHYSTSILGWVGKGYTIPLFRCHCMCLIVCAHC